MSKLFCTFTHWRSWLQKIVGAVIIKSTENKLTGFPSVNSEGKWVKFVKLSRQGDVKKRQKQGCLFLCSLFVPQIDFATADLNILFAFYPQIINLLVLGTTLGG